MNIKICFVISFCFFNIISCVTNSSFEDDYYLNYDYEIYNKSLKSDLKPPESFLLPNPKNINSKYTLDVLPNVELPDDSLSDADLKDHDFIDNLMYVYYGSHNKNGNNYGHEAIIIGSVLSFAAQFFTIFFVCFKKKLNGRYEMKTCFLHLMTSLCFSNLLFMLGVNAIKNHFKCLTVALVLHYLHLLSAFWMFLYCYYIYKHFSEGNVAKKNYFYSCAYVVPLLFSILSFLIAPHSLETKRFCFMSVQKGMILNYMLPVSLLLVATTVTSLNGIRKINIVLSKFEFTSSVESLNVHKHELENAKDKRNDLLEEEILSLNQSKNCLKLLCAVQTVYNIVWFISVLALENNTDNNSMAIIYAIVSCLLYWFMFLKTKSFLPYMLTVCQTFDSEEWAQKLQHINRRNDVSIARNKGSSDSIPLLIKIAENCTEMTELHIDYISTISN